MWVNFHKIFWSILICNDWNIVPTHISSAELLSWFLCIPLMMFSETQRFASGHGVTTPPEIQRNGQRLFCGEYWYGFGRRNRQLGPNRRNCSDYQSSGEIDPCNDVLFGNCRRNGLQQTSARFWFPRIEIFFDDFIVESFANLITANNSLLFNFEKISIEKFCVGYDAFTTYF